MAPGKQGSSCLCIVLPSLRLFEFYFLDSSAAAGSGEHTDPKQLRKLRQQQLQQKFRKEMEARKLQQEQDQPKSQDTAFSIMPGADGGKGSSPFCYRLSDHL